MEAREKEIPPLLFGPPELRIPNSKNITTKNLISRWAEVPAVLLKFVAAQAGLRALEPFSFLREQFAELLLEVVGVIFFFLLCR